MDDFEKKTTSLEFSLKLVGLFLLVIVLISAGLSTPTSGMNFLTKFYFLSMGVGLIAFLVGLILLIPKQVRGIGKSLILAGIMAVVLANMGCMAIFRFAKKTASEVVIN